MAELILRSLPYQRDSSALIRRIAALPGAACLDSGLGSQLEGRYDILTSLPSRQLRLRPGGAPSDDIEQRWHDDAAWRAVPGQSCIFAAAETLLLQDAPDSESLNQLSELPFCGGVIACFGYESAANSPAQSLGTELTGMLRQTPVATCGLYQWAVIVDHQCQTTVLFVLPDCPEQIRHQVLRSIAGNGTVSQPAERGFSLVSAFQAQLSPAQYEAAFDRLKSYIVAGDCYQANLAIAFVARYQGDPVHAYLRLRQGSRSPFSAFFDSGDAQVLSLSPERFVSVRDRQVVTQPIKGTRKRSSNPVTDKQLSDELQASEKDRAENLMIVDLLRNDLGSVCEIGSVRTRDLFKLHSFSQVHHLISTVTGTLPADVSPLTLLRQCFPGGSITGAPKIRAMEIIAELEPLPRAVYCGSIVYCDYRGRMDSNISIRTLLCRQDHIFCWGGGGIVADSDMAREYQEAHDKVSALLELVSARTDLQG
ncbi:MAG: aminodeoxychorismate synthase, component I [Gammaproteobacteria bacterium]|nr:aminodeoxychorismate synthase, component I [Gammaproteobacteria bacterium]